MTSAGNRWRCFAGLVLIAGLMGCGSDPTQPERPSTAATESMPYRERQVYWGDLHVHSRYSFDAYSLGNEEVSADDAYRFAKGEPVELSSGHTARLRRPLDFLMVSDHAEYLGVLAGIDELNPALDDNVLGSRWQRYVREGRVAEVIAEYVRSINESRPLDDYLPEPYIRSVWSDLIAAADRHNDPGRFTAFIGFEWTSMTDGRNLHRNVVFRDGADRTRKILPFSALDSPDPERLWRFLRRYEKDTGGRALAIPHNGNLSNGKMFSGLTFDDGAMDAEYARARARWEPVYEMTQVKGDAEAHPALSPDDPFADFENWDATDINMTPKPEDQRVDMYRGEYARPALQRGLLLQQTLGANPYKFGMAGSTDSHTGLATAEDDNFFGKFLDSQPSPDRLDNRMAGVLWDNRELTASGYTGIWAVENTREALFDAMARREVYATTGPRIVLRFFGGWDFQPDDTLRPDFSRYAYDRGVPMGADLPTASAVAPTFLVSAASEPDGANLDRVQIVKSWIDADSGVPRERVYDVAYAPREEGTGATVAKLPSTVDLSDATYANDIGAPELLAYWRDPGFDADVPAVYYVRVLEIETPRWTTYDAVRYGLPIPDDVPATVQQRAYSSPIWYTPDR